MDPAELIAIVTGLLTPEPAPVFDALRDGGPKPACPVVIEACEGPSLGFELEGQTIICGTVAVPEYHDAEDGRRLPIEFAILHSTSAAPFPDPVVYLHGGPGEGTLGSIARVQAMFAEHRRTRDIVTFDQRAAGLTARNLLCVESLSENAELVAAQPAEDSTGPDEAIVALTAACVSELEGEGVDLSFYNTVMNARDVRAVVEGLGYDDYNIYGISYGTRLALEVMRTIPEGVRSVVLDSVVPMNVRLYDELLGQHQDAIDALVQQCAEDPDCAEAYPDFGTQIAEVAADLRDNPIPRGRGSLTVTEDLFLPLFQGRNLAATFVDVTNYPPRITAELAERETTALDHYVSQADAGDISPLRRIFRATVDLDADERVLAQTALQAAGLIESAQELATTALTQLETDLRTGATGAGLAAEFSAGLEAAAEQATDDATRTAMLSAVLALQEGEQTRERLADMVRSHVLPPQHTRLLNFVDAMTETEI
jgi:pimeloyl-ACP methyl ester carboxylesterase